MDEDSAVRITRSENEIVKWPALLRHNAYLSVSTPYIRSFSGEHLSDGLLKLGEGCDELRLLYWQKVREGIPMESIWYDNIQIQCADDPSSYNNVIDCYEPAFDSNDDSDLDSDS